MTTAPQAGPHENALEKLTLKAGGPYQTCSTV